MIDIQNETDIRDVYIKDVGIKDFSLPIMVPTKKDCIHTTAKVSLSVSLDSQKRGVHMSRLVEVLSEWDGYLDFKKLEMLLATTQDKLETKNSNISICFLYFRKKFAPISKKSSYISYECILNMKNIDDYFTLTVKVPVSSVCPCSKAISKYGAHNQRGVLSITVKTDSIFSIEDLILEAELSCSKDVFPLLKRSDERFITESAYDNPKFVEDIARDTVLSLSRKKDYQWVSVNIENFESIHAHNVFATVDSF